MQPVPYSRQMKYCALLKRYRHYNKRFLDLKCKQQYFFRALNESAQGTALKKIVK